MARLNSPVLSPGRGGDAAPTVQDGDPVNHHQVLNSGRTVVVVQNAGVSPVDVTFETPGTVDGLAVADRVVSVAAGTTLYFGEFGPRQYGGMLLIQVASADLKLWAIEA